MKILILAISLNFFSVNNPSYNIWVTAQRVKILRENYGNLTKSFLFKQINSIIYNVITGYKKQCNLRANKYIYPIS